MQKKEGIGEVDELDKLTNQATKKGSLEERLGLSPEIIEKKVSAKKAKGKGNKTKIFTIKSQFLFNSYTTEQKCKLKQNRKLPNRG